MYDTPTHQPSLASELPNSSTMADASSFLSTKRYAVVTGANKGIGFGICKQLASNGVVVVLTARDETKGLQAVQSLKDSGFSDFVVFHQLDVTNPKSVTSLADFVKTQFGKLDILVNNAGVAGFNVDYDAFTLAAKSGKSFDEINWSEISSQPYELIEQGVETNYYGPKRMTEAFLPLLQLSDSPRIVNVSSSMGQLKVLSDADNLTEEKIEEVIHKFLRDSKDGSLARDGWPLNFSAYIVAKAALNAYTRVMAKKYPNIRVNCVCPGYVKTDINGNTGKLSIEEGAESPVKLALMPLGGPSGLFFVRQEVSPF